jgi:hypothetical protein
MASEPVLEGTVDGCMRFLRGLIPPAWSKRDAMARKRVEQAAVRGGLQKGEGMNVPRIGKQFTPARRFRR